MTDTTTITPEDLRLLRNGYGDHERLRLLTALEAARRAVAAGEG